MIQDDFGNLVEPTHARTINERLDAGDRRMAAIEIDLAANTRATQELAEHVKGVVDFFSTMEGAFKAIDMLGRLAKPLRYILAFGAAAVSFWAAIKSGHIGPRS